MVAAVHVDMICVLKRFHLRGVDMGCVAGLNVPLKLTKKRPDPRPSTGVRNYGEERWERAAPELQRPKPQGRKHKRPK